MPPGERLPDLCLQASPCASVMCMSVCACAHTMHMAPSLLGFGLQHPRIASGSQQTSPGHPLLYLSSPCFPSLGGPEKGTEFPKLARAAACTPVPPLCMDTVAGGDISMRSHRSHCGEATGRGQGGRGVGTMVQTPMTGKGQGWARVWKGPRTIGA